MRVPHPRDRRTACFEKEGPMERLLLGLVVPTLPEIIGHDEERVRRRVSGGMVRIFSVARWFLIGERYSTLI